MLPIRRTFPKAKPGTFFRFTGNIRHQSVGFSIKDTTAQAYTYYGELQERDALKNINPSSPDNTMIQLGTSKALCPKRSTIGPKISEPISMPRGRNVTSDVVCNPLNPSLVTREGSTEPSVIIETPKKHIPIHAAVNTRFYDSRYSYKWFLMARNAAPINPAFPDN